MGIFTDYYSEFKFIEGLIISHGDIKLFVKLDIKFTGVMSWGESLWEESGCFPLFRHQWWSWCGGYEL